MLATESERISLSPPWVGREERRLVAAAFASGYLAPVGPQLEEFERRIRAATGRRYALALSSGTAAIDLAMEVMGVGKGWTVFAPTLAYIASVAPAVQHGARLVLVDVDPVSGLIDLQRLEAALRDEAAVAPRSLVIGVDIFGRACDYRSLERLCRRYHSRLLIDAAESLGATSRGASAGSGGEAAILSFNGNKVVTASAGGALVTDSRRLYEAARKLSRQAKEKGLGYKFRSLGYNYQLSNLLAAVGAAQLGKLATILRRRRATSRWYAGMVKRLNLGEMLTESAAYPNRSNAWLNVLICPSARQRNRLIRLFAAANIEAREGWRPMHLQPVFRKVKCYGGENAERIYRCGICLPSGTGIGAAERRRIAAVLAAAR